MKKRVLKTIGAGSGIATIIGFHQRLEEESQINRKGRELARSMDRREELLTNKLSTAESKVVNAHTQIQLMENKQKLAELSGHREEVKKCGAELSRLNHAAAEKTAILQNTESVVECQREDLTILEYQILPAALDTRSLSAFMHIVPATAAKDIKRASLEKKDALRPLTIEMKERVEAFKSGILEYQDVVDETDNVDF